MENAAGAAALCAGSDPFHDAFEEAPIPYHVLDCEGRIRLVNRAEREMLGYTAEEMLGRPVWEFSQDPEGSRERLLSKFSGKMPLKPHERRFLRRDGTVLTMELHETAVLDGENRMVGIRTVALDITERKRNEEILAWQTGELARSNTELEQFAYVASHDLQEPLRMVASYTQLLARRYKGKLDSDADEFIAFAVDGASRMQTLINDLLAYSRLGRRGGQMRPVDAEDVLARVFADLHASIAETGADVKCGPLPTLAVDPVQFGQLMQNLISNAIKFRTGERPRVRVTAERCGYAWRFCVADNGIGIDPSYSERIFQIFQRLHTRSEYPGTGIGLAICRKIVERHGGRIWVESQQGQGARFFFLIPDPPEAQA